MQEEGGLSLALPLAPAPCPPPPAQLQSEKGQDWVNEDHRRETVQRWLQTTEDLQAPQPGAAQQHTLAYIPRDSLREGCECSEGLFTKRSRI